MKVIKENLLAAAMLVVLSCVTGCGGVNDKPELGQVTGAITLDGEPLVGIAVVFSPDSGRPARGKTNAEGKYDLTYIREERGTKLGHNRVEVAPDEEGDEESAEAQSDDSEAKPKAKAKAKGGKPTIPSRYNTKSELEADVKPGDNVFDFKLQSK